MNTAFLCLVLAQTQVYPDGTLLFVEYGDPIVMNETGSTLSHVAVILRDANENYVYDAYKPRVKKISLNTYLEGIKQFNHKREYHRKRPCKIWIMIPRILYNDSEVKRMRTYLENNVGRLYGIKSYLSGSSSLTIHCGELASNTLKRAGLLIRSNPCTNTPGNIWCACRPFYTWKKLSNLSW